MLIIFGYKLLFTSNFNTFNSQFLAVLESYECMIAHKIGGNLLAYYSKSTALILHLKFCR